MDYFVNYVSADSLKTPESTPADDRKAEDENNENGETVAVPASIYAIAEMSKRAEEYALKVRSELSRIGYRPSELSVLRQGIYLQMKYQQQIILVSPQEVLGVLHKIPRGTELAEIWERICQHAHQLEKKKRLGRSWSAAVVVSLLLLAAFLVFYRVY